MIAENYKNVVIIRYNPDSYKVNGKTKRTSKETRYEKLIETINKYINCNVNEQLFECIYLFYNS